MLHSSPFKGLWGHAKSASSNIRCRYQLTSIIPFFWVIEAKPVLAFFCATSGSGGYFSDGVAKRTIRLPFWHFLMYLPLTANTWRNERQIIAKKLFPNASFWGPVKPVPDRKKISGYDRGLVGGPSFLRCSLCNAQWVLPSAIIKDNFSELHDWTGASAFRMMCFWSAIPLLIM